MTTKIYTVCGGLDSCEVTSDAAAVIRERTSKVVANYSIVSISIGGINSTFRTWMLDPVTQAKTPVNSNSFWYHMLFNEADFNGSISGTAAGRNWQINKADGTGLVRMRKTATTIPGIYIVDYWNGAAWVNIAAPSANVTLTNSIDKQIDVQIVFSATVGAVRVYIDKVLTFEQTGLNTSTWEAAYVDHYSPSTQNNTASDTGFSQMIAADASTLDFKLKTRPMNTGQGLSTAFTGTNLDIDENPYSDADFISSAVTGDKESVTGGAYAALPAGTEIKAVCIGARVRNDGGTSPQNIKAFIRVAGADYDAGGNMRIATNFNGSINIFNTNPATTGDWGAGLPASTDQYGLKSVA
jgi:hypothetical protein